MDKQCFKCNVVKDILSFYKHASMKDGHLNKCKECTRLDTIENRKANIDYYTEYEKKRAMLPHRVMARAEYAAANKDIVNRAKHSWRLRNKEKARAYSLLQYAVSVGKVIKSECVICGDIKVQGHHTDYSKPLEVIWLCAKCHKKVHKGELDIPF